MHALEEKESTSPLRVLSGRVCQTEHKEEKESKEEHKEASGSSTTHKPLKDQGDGSQGEMSVAGSKTLRQRCIQAIDLLWDLFTVVLSHVDIVTDVLVAWQFYKAEKFTFFWGSVIIFCVAQMSYAFLFTATWGKEWSPIGMVVVYLLVLPFGQFVPFFTWLESFHFTCLDKLITKLGLRPTESIQKSLATGEGDGLWTYIQHKYQAHAGFLAEAFVEAIPQCILQIAAVTTASKATWLNVLSILLSIIVIGSKGYLIAYSIHWPTFVFNYIAILSDCVGMFATAVWLFSAGSTPFYETWWFYLCAPGIGLSVMAGFALVWFTMYDDHIKDRRRDLYSMMVPIKHPAFEIYGTRFLAWLLAILPCAVVFVASKLTFLPVLAFRSLDPEHAVHSIFYRPLFQFLTQHSPVPGDKALRLKVANKFFAQARLALPLLRTRVNVAQNTGVSKKEKLIEWLACVGDQTKMTRNTVYVPASKRTAQQEAEAKANQFASAVLSTLDDGDADGGADDTGEEHARVQLRRMLLNQKLADELDAAEANTLSRSEVLAVLKRKRSLSEHRNCCDLYLVIAGCVCVVSAGLLACLWLPTVVVFVCYNFAFPVVQLISEVPSDANFLARVLSYLYVALMCTLLFFARSVWQFQLARADLFDLKNGFPGLFYCNETVEQIKVRYLREVTKREVVAALSGEIGGKDVAKVVLEYWDADIDFQLS
mmetsp:Transcript_12460/g.23924  ORF Transcript_12460/g.23924 Transcript_12460/m.23924 type:complete len:709 (+) Transcript_12460:90-2216(+)